MNVFRLLHVSGSVLNSKSKLSFPGGHMTLAGLLALCPMSKGQCNLLPRFSVWGNFLNQRGGEQVCDNNNVQETVENHRLLVLHWGRGKGNKNHQ